MFSHRPQSCLLPSLLPPSLPPPFLSFVPSCPCLFLLSVPFSIVYEPVNRFVRLFGSVDPSIKLFDAVGWFAGRRIFAAVQGRDLLGTRRPAPGRPQGSVLCHAVTLRNRHGHHAMPARFAGMPSALRPLRSVASTGSEKLPQGHRQRRLPAGSSAPSAPWRRAPRKFASGALLLASRFHFDVVRTLPFILFIHLSFY